MGSFDGAKCCELIGLYILNKLTTGKFAPFKSSQLGLYRNDGLAVVKIRGRQGGILDSLRKKEIEIFKKEELNITVEHGMINKDFLDVRLDLGMAEYRPFRKENDCPVFIHAQSNHPPRIISQINPMINHRLSTLSSNQKVFNVEKSMYVKAWKSNLPCDLQYTPSGQKKHKRNRNPIYYNHPFSLNVKTNISAAFLKLVDKHFNKDHSLQKFFNRSKIKVSYCDMPNMKQHINKHNAKILREKQDTIETRSCN